MIWAKVWTTWAWWTTKNHPDYIEVYSMNELEERLTQIDQDHSYSDKYRGTEYEIIDHPPVNILRTKIQHALENAVCEQARALRFKQELDRLLDKLEKPS